MKKIIFALIVFLFSGISALGADIFELCRIGTPEEVQDAIKAGADVNAVDDFGRTALKWLKWSEIDVGEILPVLLKAGADINAKNNEGKRAIDYFEENERLKLSDEEQEDKIKELLERWQAYINARFGYSVHYPAIFDNRKDPDNGDGIWLTSNGEKYALTVSGGYNVLGDDGASLLASRFESIAHVAPGSDESDETWYRVIYGGDTLSHEYGIINDENWASFILTYPKNEKARFAPIISQMEESLSLK